ncbi:menaquinone-dependent protoporphyrinogen IX dehydrogenase [Candidatus Pantoea edessiphila]|uniref:Protoporphyrinogen IX dehydrogenase [quinone] n=1 Tax=Candidatus Pantoea edessiphila TaxID=2044610 RepID=A0A2P5SVC7_9GAMM|nr:menaquinone-dependent protoporphyrinogen IX dehydrogenase [Candidatus Pantoea edessiphila]PPI86271.1 menaquinone-dependent protoporphyrinogen IX dehydrogenase [Candidatus Pantoea edessiphila]
MKALIIFYSRNGQTKKIASYIADHMRTNQLCDLVNIRDAIHINFDWKQYNRILIGASIYYGYFNPIVDIFIKSNLLALKKLISGFFSVNLTARKYEKSSPHTNSYTYKFLVSSPWKPDCCAVFAGALQYSRYHWLDRAMIKIIMFITGGETNSQCDIEYTDWEQVKIFTNFFQQIRKQGFI